MGLPFAEVGLDAEVTERDFVAHMAFAKAYSRDAEAEVRLDRKTDLLLLAASSFRRAGASAMLLGMQTEMRNAFFWSAQQYLGLRMPYSAQMDILSKAGQRDSYEKTFLGMNANPAELVYPLMYAELHNIRGKAFDRVFDELSNLKRDTVGIFQLPVFDFVDLIGGIKVGPFERTAEAFKRIVAAYDGGVRSASSRKTEWRLLVQEMHPAEPDIMGPLAMVYAHLSLKRIQEYLLRFEMSQTTRLLLLSCLETYLSGGSTDVAA
jgi:hypothetical protein